jgi:subtilase family serine protease
LGVEQLECRVLLSWAPDAIRDYYGFNRIQFGSVPGDGRGQTIALIEAYNEPNLVSDVDAFDKDFSIDGGAESLYQEYGANNTFLTQISPWGANPAPAGLNGWGEEAAADVE